MRWSGFRLRACAEALTAFTILLIAPDTAPAQAATAELPRDLSPWGMYLTADSLVKGVLIALVLASVITWTVWLAKSIELIAAKRRARNALTALAAVRDIVGCVGATRTQHEPGGTIRSGRRRRAAPVGRNDGARGASRSASHRGSSGSRRTADAA